MGDWVVRAGEAKGKDLVAGYREHGGLPGTFGFSVQYAPGQGKSVDELARAGRFRNAQISYATDTDLIAAAMRLGYGLAFVPSPGTGYHYTCSVLLVSAGGVVLPKIPSHVADATSQAFQRVPNPHRVTGP